ncbi:MAG TPA: hypothetical protein VH370_22370 [Humisphaera sp.]|jgi:hypothetical protein|nr:hypothetical protein [Humisphaera sp.]
MNGVRIPHLSPQSWKRSKQRAAKTSRNGSSNNLNAAYLRALQQRRGTLRAEIHPTRQ